MYKKAFIIIVIQLGLFLAAHAQDKKPSIIKGKIKNQVTKTPFNEITVTLLEQNLNTKSDGSGNFELSGVTNGKKTLVFTSTYAISDTQTIDVNKDLIDMTDIYITPNKDYFNYENSDIPTIQLSDNTDDDDNSDYGPVKRITSSSSNYDVFLDILNNVSIYHGFQPRGLGRNTKEVEVNGIPLTNAVNGNADVTVLGGLFDVFHRTNVTYGLQSTPYAFGGINGFTYYDATAAGQQKETKITYRYDYNVHTVSVTESSGQLKNGWAFSGSIAKRWLDWGQSYTPGTFIDQYSYSFAASKIIGRGTLNISTFGTPRQLAKTSAAVQEAYELSGSHYYNQNWGKMPDKDSSIRSDAVQKVFQPVTIINYLYQPNEKTRWNTAFGYEFGKDQQTSLQNYNGDASVIGDYYKNMPFYYYNLVPADSTTGNRVKQNILANKNVLQLNWNRMYQDNYANILTMNNVNGVSGKTFTGKQSIYVLGAGVKDLQKGTFNTNIEHEINEGLLLSGGLTITDQRVEFYDLMDDLLGGDYFVNYNQFASQSNIGPVSYNQNNLNNPNQVIKVGDKYGYDYSINTMDEKLWGQVNYNINKFNLFITGSGGNNSFYRDGFMRNGLFANNSYGVSATHSFFDYAVKGGAIYKISERNILFANAAYTMEPPLPTNTYLSARTRDYIVNSPTDFQTQDFECGYILKYPGITFRLKGYVTDQINNTEIRTFYNDDPAYRTSVYYVMQGENTRHTGIETDLDYKLSNSFNLVGFVTIGQSFYTNNPSITEYLDNDTTVHANPSKTYIKNYYLGAGPQSAYIGEINYHGKSGYHGSIHFNYLDRNYVAVNPNRRTQDAASVITNGSAQWHAIFDQEKLPAAFTVDISGGRTIRFSRNSIINHLLPSSVLSINATISNVLNNTDIRSSGFEQLRFDFRNFKPGAFPNKYFYERPIDFRLSINLKF